MSRTGLEDAYIMRGSKKLRMGYTTGSCAAAAARGAAFMLLSGKEIQEVKIHTPKGIVLNLELLDIRRSAEKVSCAVRKDGGDDPDVTDGLLVFAQARFLPENTGNARVIIDEGEGVGRVTKPGLDQPVGEAAINHVPRAMIKEALEKEAESAGYAGGFDVTISIEGGAETAKRTFNPHMGVEGGLSVLGTSGIVEPMSQQAILDTIQLEMGQAALRAGTPRRLILAPGNYGLDYLHENLPTLKCIPVVKTSNFIGDALDMAGERGESVAFTNAYAGNLRELAELLALYAEKTGKESVPLNRDLFVLLADDDTLYASVQKKQELLTRYTDACIHEVSGQKTEVSITELVRSLQKKAAFLTGHIRATEWVNDEEGNGWFNGYYDNHGRCVEGVFAQGVRMMLTSQVFAVMAQTATDEQVAEIVRSADKYLYCDAMGGYRLNTDFGEVKMDLGRMFGFAYGEKENGAVFSHMAVMFANALYKRGFVKEGHRALDALYRQSVHFETSRIYPGIPEYFNSRGKGMYHYLTGAASWYMLTVITEMFGAKGCAGNLMLEPKLERQQFDLDERAELFFSFAGQSLHLVYENKEHKEYGAYRPGTIRIDGELWDYSGGEKETRSVCIDRERLKQLDFDVTHEILVELV